jgi:hypothetical protein
LKQDPPHHKHNVKVGMAVLDSLFEQQKLNTYKKYEMTNNEMEAFPLEL